MGNKKDSLGDRMKRYENVSKVSLVRRLRDGLYTVR